MKIQCNKIVDIGYFPIVNIKVRAGGPISVILTNKEDKKLKLKKHPNCPCIVDFDLTLYKDVAKKVEVCNKTGFNAQLVSEKDLWQ